MIFSVIQDDLIAGEEEATCPSCSLVVKVIYDPVRYIYRMIQIAIFKQRENIVFQEMFKAAEDEETNQLDEKLKQLAIEK